MGDGDAETSNKTDGNLSDAIDPSSPYYLHPSDFPKQLHNKIDFVDGTIKKPKIDSTKYKSWMRCDVMIKRWLTTSMEKTIHDSVKYVGTALEMWLDLQGRFGKENAPRANELK
ncbi:hypothetical protein Tco_0413808 [Tanacetum coccineum]